MAAVDTYPAHADEADGPQAQTQPGPGQAPPPGLDEEGQTQTMWVFQSLRDALMGFAEIDFSEMISDGEEEVQDSDLSEVEDDDDEDELALETKQTLDDPDNDDPIELIGRFPTLAQLQETLRNASSFLTPPPQPSNAAPVERELAETSDANESELTHDLESVGRFPTLQEMQEKLRNASNLFPRNGTSSLRFQQALQQYSQSLPSLDTYQLPKPLETFQKFWASYPQRLPQRPPTPRELLAKWSPGWSPSWSPAWSPAWAREPESVVVEEPEPTEPIPDASELTEDEKIKSFGADGGLGCEHYMRNCKVQCPDCHKFYPCRLCHDEHETHELRRKAVCNMLCMLCLTPQRAAEYCSECHELMADYYCNVCKMWSDDPERPIFHCDECGICRVGQGLGIDVFHCTKCGICMDLALENNHKCIVTKGPQSDCPICLDDLFQSTLPIVIMPCGHPIHRHCFDEYTKRYYRCPVCSRSVLNTSAMFRLLDEEISREVLPPELEDVKVSIHCHDCGMRTRTQFHLAGLKCTTCGSYNTAKT